MHDQIQWYLIASLWLFNSSNYKSKTKQHFYFIRGRYGCVTKDMTRWERDDTGGLHEEFQPQAVYNYNHINEIKGFEIIC